MAKEFRATVRSSGTNCASLLWRLCAASATVALIAISLRPSNNPPRTAYRERSLVPSHTNFPYLFKSLEAELQNTQAGSVTGKIPRWIDGTWVKTGFCLFESSTYAVSMLFDAAGCGYSVSISGSKVSISAKRLRSNYYQAFNDSKLPLWRTFDEFRPERTGWARLATLVSQDQADNYLVNLVSLGNNRTAALTDLAGEIELDLASMATKGRVYWNDTLESDSWNMISSAHPSRAVYHRGSFFNFLLNMNIPLNLLRHGMPFVYNVFRMDVDRRTRTLIASLPTRHHHYVHENALTQNFFIIIEFPFFWKFFKIIGNTAIKNALEFHPNEGIHFKVLDLNTKTLRGDFHLTGESFYAFHQINAYEEDGKIVMLMTAYDDIDYHLKNSFSLHEGHLNNTFDLPPATLRKVSIDLRTGKIDTVKLGDVDFELPVVSDKVRGRRNRFAYAHSKSVSRRNNDCKAGPGCGGTWWDTVVKVDLESGREVAQWRQDDFWPSEPVFVPNEADHEEDDGVLLNIVLGDGPRSYLLVLDAKNLSEIARAALPGHLPYQSHGNWVGKNLHG